MASKEENKKVLDLAEVLLTRLSASKVARMLELSFYTCRKLKTKVRKKNRQTEKKRFFPYGPKSRLLILMYERSFSVLDVILFTDFYPSDIVACLDEHLDLEEM